MDYRDFQTIKSVPDATQGPVGTRVTVDSADATIKGVETEFIRQQLALVGPARDADDAAAALQLRVHDQRRFEEIEGTGAPGVDRQLEPGFGLVGQLDLEVGDRVVGSATICETA